MSMDRLINEALGRLGAPEQTIRLLSIVAREMAGSLAARRETCTHEGRRVLAQDGEGREAWFCGACATLRNDLPAHHPLNVAGRIGAAAIGALGPGGSR